ncbi:hypothetical protein [Streptomyces sp. NPDC060065]|uniref:hypothetical protein n=1 Tax=Streptomyces sp. NPDC060065 TaxID=3347050 RepID=UPI0036756AB8
MVVDEPYFRINENRAARANVFGPITEHVAVADWGLAIDSFFGHHIPDTYYQLTHCMASFWPGDAGCRLTGDHIHEGTGSRCVEKMDSADVITPEMARKLLAPLFDSAPPGPDPAPYE